ncbi:MAG: hypothetical protein VXA12_04670 [Gammaproteobacteria bacterium]
MQCELCGRRAPLTRHHLIPKRTHRFGSVRSRYSKAELNSLIAYFCKACHRHVHRTCKERELAVGYYSVELLLAHPEIQQFVDWLKDKPDDFTPRLSRRKKT